MDFLRMWKQGGSQPEVTPSSRGREFQTNYAKGREYVLQAVNIEETLKEGAPDFIQKALNARDLYQKGIDLFKKAERINVMEVSVDQRKEVSDSKRRMENYQKSAEERSMTLLNKLSSQATSAQLKQMGAQSRAAAGSSNSRNLSSGNRSAMVVQTMNANAARLNQERSRQALLKGVDPKIGELILAAMNVDTTVRLFHVCGCEAAKLALEESVILPRLNPDLFTGLRQPVKGILLYGPPGNGKTMLAKAVANESNQQFFNVSASTLMSKWVGDGEKTMRALFHIARNAQPSIIFIDEIDSLLRERSEKDSEVSRRMKTEFLVQFDGASCNDQDRILVIGATNRPQDLDDAVLRRFPKRILLGLPDDAGRHVLIKSILLQHGMLRGLQDSDVKYISSRTSGYSHADLVALCKEAAMFPVRGIDRAKLPQTSQNSVRALTISDFDKALQIIKPSSSAKQMDELYDFSKRTGG
ncbi:unnamed protein product [Auanema sp. JU1783]|nr:unnamed protein product [Auanema sp. JU1783]